MDETSFELLARSGLSSSDNADRPASYKVIGISLAIGSGFFIGISFVLKKYGLLKANEKYNEVAGEGYGYLKNIWWWSGMTLMIIGEVCNFVAYAFTDAILVTPLGALSVVITTIFSAIFLKERLSMVGKVACFLCVIGSVIIVMNAPQTSSVANIEEMKTYVVSPGFLSYTGVIIVGAVVTAFWAGPKWGNKNMLVYISICSWIGGLSVVSTQGLGAAIVAQAGGTPQFNQWFLYIVLVFVIGTLLTEIIYLNKALNLFNAAIVTPTYYVYFTSTTIITSAVLFRGFKGTATSIVTCVLGFLTICAGVVLLQLSKSAKDVPDAAVFRGDLDQIHDIAEQEEPETEPRADAIRGTAAIVRNFSTVRHTRELKEAQRLHDEKMQEQLDVTREGTPTVYEWDGIRRRRTTTFGSYYSRHSTFSPPPRSPHPPLGMTHFPTEEELEALRGPPSSGFLSSFAGSVRRSRADTLAGDNNRNEKRRSPGFPVPLTFISLPRDGAAAYDEEMAYGGAGSASDKAGGDQHLGLPSSLRHPLRLSELVRPSSPGVLGEGRPGTVGSSTSKRTFSFQNVFRRNQDDRPASSIGLGVGPKSPLATCFTRGTEEERLGLVKGDSRSLPNIALQRSPDGGGGSSGGDDDEESEDSLDYRLEEEKRVSQVLVPATALNDAMYGRNISEQPSPPRPTRGRSAAEREAELEHYEARRARWNESRSRSRGPTPPKATSSPARPQTGKSKGSSRDGNEGGMI